MGLDGRYAACILKEEFGLPLKRYGELTLRTDGDQLKGIMFPRFFWINTPFRNGTYDGNQFKFTVYFNSPCQQCFMEVEGEVVGDKIHGIVRDAAGEARIEGYRIEN